MKRNEYGFELPSVSAAFLRKKKQILAHPGVEKLWLEEENGWWISLRVGWINGEALTHWFREDTLSDLIDTLRFVREKVPGDPS